jgi:hypothetical protein
MGGGVTVIQSFTATGEWVCPTGVTEVEYLVVAGVVGVAVMWLAVVVLAVLEQEQVYRLRLALPTL